MKTAFWAAILVLVLFFGKRLLPGDEADPEKDGGVSGNENTVGYRENDGDEIQRSATVVSHGGEQYVEAASSGSWGLGFGADGSETQPTGSLSKEELAEYDAWYLGADTEKVLYLTFDCGYENGNTEKILDALHKHNAKATFFVVGHFLESAPDLVKRMKEEGHMVGNHTWHHPDMDTIAEEAKFREELDLVAAKYKEITGEELNHFYRPPQGKYNLNNLAMAKKLGYQTIFWSLAYVDWNVDAQPTKEEAFSKLTGRVHPGAVVLLHNTSKTNGEILDELLTKWEEMGYHFGTLEDLTS
ncbi:MAG: polysaccharide deacetylase family protein [Lachnospiraceae bacterium]|nr:polysaccharide deacetylase family protein [Lachnospiraceae bacterium]